MGGKDLRIHFSESFQNLDCSLIRLKFSILSNVMSKPRECKSKVYKPRDPKERFIKSTSKIPFYLFGGKKTPLTNPTQRYIYNGAQKGQSFVTYITESQSQAEVKSESTVEQILGIPQESELVIEQPILIENLTNFLEIPFQKTIVLLIEAHKEEAQEKVPPTTHPFNTCDNPLTEPLYIDQHTIPEIKNFSLFENMAGEEEERVVNEEQEDKQTFRFSILDLT